MLILTARKITNPNNNLEKYRKRKVNYLSKNKKMTALGYKFTIKLIEKNLEDKRVLYLLFGID